MDLLIKDALILTFDHSFSIRKGSIAIEGGKIKKISKNMRKGDADEVINARGKVVMPAMILPYCSLQNCLLVGRRSPSFWKRVNQNQLQTAVRWACLRLLRSGVVFVSNVIHTVKNGNLFQTAQEMEEAEMRGFLALELSEHGKSGYRALSETERFLERNPSKRIKGLVCVHACTSDDILQEARELASSFRTKLLIVISRELEHFYYVSREFGTSPMGRIINAGLLEPNAIVTHYVHRVQCTELEELQKSGAKLVHILPDSGYLEDFSPVEEALHKNITSGIGMERFMDVFELMRNFFFSCQQRKITLEPKHVLAMFTRMPAEMYGLNSGCVEQGRVADLLVLDLPELKGGLIYETILTACTSHFISAVIAGGKLIDEEKLRYREKELKMEFYRVLKDLYKKDIRNPEW